MHCLKLLLLSPLFLLHIQYAQAASCARAVTVKVRGIATACELHFNDGSKREFPIMPSQESLCRCAQTASNNSFRNLVVLATKKIIVNSATDQEI